MITMNLNIEILFLIIACFRINEVRPPFQCRKVLIATRIPVAHVYQSLSLGDQIVNQRPFPAFAVRHQEVRVSQHFQQGLWALLPQILTNKLLDRAVCGFQPCPAQLTSQSLPLGAQVQERMFCRS